MSIVSFLRRLKRALTPPGNRPSLEESGEQSAAPTGMEPGSPGGMADSFPGGH